MVINENVNGGLSMKIKIKIKSRSKNFEIFKDPSLEEDQNLWYGKFCLEPSCPSGRRPKRGQSAIVKRLIALSAKT